MIAPKYILKFINKSGSSDTSVYYCKNQLITDMVESWGAVDLILQQFVIPKTLQATIYRFYRNERNVFRTECIINKRSIVKDSATTQAFQTLYRNNKEEHLHQSGKKKNGSGSRYTSKNFNMLNITTNGPKNVIIPHCRSLESTNMRNLNNSMARQAKHKFLKVPSPIPEIRINGVSRDSNES